MPTQSAARKAWNEAMKATAGATALPPGLQQRPLKRRSDRHRKQERRARARKVQRSGENDGGDGKEYRCAVWVDALEGIDPGRQPLEEDDDEYDELEELESAAGGGGRNGSKRKRGGKGGRKAKAGVLPKRFMPRSLASVLVEEASREDGVARAFLNAEARLPKRQRLPVRKFCPVTGTEAAYVEPKTGIPYSNFRALEQIRERSPPWMTLTGNAAYWEAAKSIQDED